jgi:hypothetical protein
MSRMDTTGKVVKLDYEPCSIGDNAGHSSVMLYWHLKALGHSERAIRDWIDHPDWRRECREYKANPPTHLNDALQIPKPKGRAR